MKRLIVILITAITLNFVPANSTPAKDNKDVKLVKQYCKKHYNLKKYKVVFIKEKNLSAKKLKNRKKNKIIYVEIVKSKSNGKYGLTKSGNYVAYNKKVKKRKWVKSHFIYNPRTTSGDDVVAVVDNGKIR